jgi:hypothetical protein
MSPEQFAFFLPPIFFLLLPALLPFDMMCFSNSSSIASVMYCIVVIIEVGLYFTLYRFVAFGVIGSRHARALLPTSFPSKIWPKFCFAQKARFQGKMSMTSHPGFWQNDFNLRKVVGWCRNLTQSGLFPNIIRPGNLGFSMCAPAWQKISMVP